VLRRLLETDDQWSRAMRVAERSGVLRVLAVFFAHSGDSWFWLLGLAILWAFGNEYWRSRAVIMISGVLLTAILVMAVKFTVRRKRPAGEWGEIYRNTDPHSFPSGHAARSMMLAVLTCGLGPGWLGIVLLVWAPWVGLARVAMGVHFLSDIVAGSLVGLVMGWLVFLLF
jgi:undecaprenyl-diphosphatase